MPSPLGPRIVDAVGQTDPPPPGWQPGETGSCPQQETQGSQSQIRDTEEEQQNTTKTTNNNSTENVTDEVTAPNEATQDSAQGTLDPDHDPSRNTNTANETNNEDEGTPTIQQPSVVIRLRTMIYVLGLCPLLCVGCILPLPCFFVLKEKEVSFCFQGKDHVWRHSVLGSASCVAPGP